MRQGKREKVIKSKRWGSEWTREEQRRKGYPGPTRGVLGKENYVSRQWCAGLHNKRRIIFMFTNNM